MVFLGWSIPPHMQLLHIIICHLDQLCDVIIILSKTIANNTFYIPWSLVFPWHQNFLRNHKNKFLLKRSFWGQKVTLSY